MVTKGKWEYKKGIVNYRIKSDTEEIAEVFGNLNDHSSQALKDANLICAAVNACKSINPEHPELVAGKIEAMYNMLGKVHSTIYLTGDTILTGEIERLLARIERREA
jgi:C1A family cysteine protease